MSARRARLATVAPNTTSHPASATSLPHWPGEIQVPGRISSAAPTPKLAGLNRCLPRMRSANFDAIAKTAAAGSAHRLSARKSNVRLSAVIVALNRLGAGFRVSRSSRRCVLSAATKVSTICSGRRLKSRKYAPAASSDPKNAICRIRGSRGIIALARAASAARRDDAAGSESTEIPIAPGSMLPFLGTWNERARDCLQDLLGWDFGRRAAQAASAGGIGERWFSGPAPSCCRRRKCCNLCRSR